MAKTKQVLLTLTLLATAPIIKNRLVNYHGNQAGAGEAAVGAAVYDADAGDSFAVDAQGVVLVESGGALAVGDAVAADAQGCAVKQAAAAVTVGRALDTTTAANELVRIKLGG